MLPASSKGTRVHLSVQNLRKVYGTFTSVSDLSFSLRQGELLGLLGPSGCGKTTTLRMVGGLVSATSGAIMVGERNVTGLPPYRRNMGVMFQSYALFPHLTIARNVAFGLEMRRIARDEIRRRVAWALDLVQLGHLSHRRPRELSGGQQQRVALARALVIEPDILLLDEPLSNLDAKLREGMRNEIRDIQQRLNITTLFVTHDQTEAMAICDRIAVMRAGRIEQIASPLEIYERPANPFVADFVGRISRFEGIWQEGGRIRLGETTIAAPDRGTPGEAATVMVRPHRISLGPPGAAADRENRLAGTVSRVTFAGEAFQYEVDCNGTRVLAEVSSRGGAEAFAAGSPVQLSWPVANTLTFAGAEP